MLERTEQQRTTKTLDASLIRMNFNRDRAAGTIPLPSRSGELAEAHL